MGKLIKILSKTKLLPGLFFKSIRIESAECIHLHWRNMRIVLNKKQFQLFHNSINKAYEKWKKINFIKGKNDGIILEDQKIPNNISIKPELSCELNENTIHVHYKDLRIELTIDEFLKFANTIKKAESQLKQI